MARDISIIVGVLPVALFFTGCAAVSPESRMGGVGAPGAWVATKEAKAGIDRKWVGNIGGSELRGLVGTAISNNQDLRAAAARVDRAGAEARIAGAGRLPSLGLGVDAGRNKQNFIGFPFGGAVDGVRCCIETFLQSAMGRRVWSGGSQIRR